MTSIEPSYNLLTIKIINLYNDAIFMSLPYKKIGTLCLYLFLWQAGLSDSPDRLVIHRAPAPLAETSSSLNWNRFNGPFNNATTKESSLNFKNGILEIKKCWELKKGEGYASPAVSKTRLILFHLDKGFEIIEARNPENGQEIWTYKYPVQYRDRYGYSNGPRASPVIFNGKVYTHGVTAWLTCLDLDTGKLIWKRDLKKEFEIPDNFFGKGSNPLVNGSNLIINLGGARGDCVGAFDLLKGTTSWITQDTWGASYSSPINAKVNGKPICLVFTGGESRPPTGGLLVIDPSTGLKLSRFPWRSKSYESANASPPVFIPPNLVFISECYEKGGVMLEIGKDFEPTILWHKPELNLHWMTPIYENNCLYGVSGRHQQGAEIFCVDVKSGTLNWKNRIIWQTNLMNREIQLEFFRGSILKVNDTYLGLSEIGSLIQLQLNPQGWKILDHQQLFFAPGTWTLPALSHGLLYIMQNETDRSSGNKPRIICYDLRGE